MTVGSFEELVVWKLSRKFAERVYRVTSIDPFARDFSLRDQLRRSNGSVMDNIAEGFERDGKKEFIQFLYMGKLPVVSPAVKYTGPRTLITLKNVSLSC